MTSLFLYFITKWCCQLNKFVNSTNLSTWHWPKHGPLQDSFARASLLVCRSKIKKSAAVALSTLLASLVYRLQRPLVIYWQTNGRAGGACPSLLPPSTPLHPLQPLHPPQHGRPSAKPPQTSPKWGCDEVLCPHYQYIRADTYIHIYISAISYRQTNGGEGVPRPSPYDPPPARASSP